MTNYVGLDVSQKSTTLSGVEPASLYIIHRRVDRRIGDRIILSFEDGPLALMSPVKVEVTACRHGLRGEVGFA